MDDKQRGIIRNKLFANQVHDFSGLKIGNITPTNIDGSIEYHNKGFVFIETKYGDAELPYGQRLYFERLCDALQKVKPTLVIVVSHNSTGDINVAEATVAEFRYKGKWRQRDGTTKELVAAFVGHLDGLWANGVST